MLEHYKGFASAAAIVFLVLFLGYSEGRDEREWDMVKNTDPIEFAAKEYERGEEYFFEIWNFNKEAYDVPGVTTDMVVKNTRLLKISEDIGLIGDGWRDRRVIQNWVRAFNETMLELSRKQSHAVGITPVNALFA